MITFSIFSPDNRFHAGASTATDPIAAAIFFLREKFNLTMSEVRFVDVVRRHGATVVTLRITSTRQTWEIGVYAGADEPDFAKFDAENAGTEWEYEPNREALAMEARAEPEGRWGDE